MWDPKPFVQSRPVYSRPIAPPTAAPCDAPLVCVSFNASYVPFVAGALSVLAQPTSWLALDQDTLDTVLSNMTQLIEIFGTAVQCNTAPLIPGQPTVQRACNIAGYIANYIIRQSMEQAIQSVQNDAILIDFVWTVLRFIPGFGQAFSITMAALPALFQAVQTSGTAVFQAAINDPTLFGAITCAIYQAIAADGEVTATNYPTVVANVNAVVFASPDVHDAVVNFLTDMGLAGLQAIQVPGAVQDYDCTGCGTGPALGPVGPSPQLVSGTDLLRIAIGQADTLLSIAFPRPFTTPPLLTVGSDNQDVIVSAVGTSTTGTTLQITSAVPATATMSANVDWVASVPGTEP